MHKLHNKNIIRFFSHNHSKTIVKFKPIEKNIEKIKMEKIQNIENKLELEQKILNSYSNNTNQRIEILSKQIEQNHKSIITMFGLTIFASTGAVGFIIVMNILN